MFNIFKAELFRIFKLKSIRILTIITLVTIVGFQALIKLDQNGAFNFNITDVTLSKPLREGDTTAEVKAKKAGRYRIMVVDLLSKSVGPISDKEYDLTTDTRTIPLNYTATKGTTITQISGKNGIQTSVPFAVALDKNDDGSGIKATFMKNQYGISNILTDIGSNWLTWLALVIGVIIFAGDFTHKRFKNYLHFTNRRISILLGKFFASFIALVVLELGFIIFGVLVAGILFGMGLPINLSAVWMKLLYFKLTITFILVFIAFLSTLTRNTAATIGLYLSKSILLGIIISVALQLLMTVQNNEFVAKIQDALNHFSNNGTSSGMLIHFTNFASNGDGQLLLAPLLYWGVYVVILAVLTYFLFETAEL